MNLDDKTPVLVGVGQLTQRDADPTAAKEPLQLMYAAAQHAAEDAGISASALSRLDSIAVVNILAWSYSNAPGALADLCGARPRQLQYSTLGGNTPQWLVNETAQQIAAGQLEFAMLAGAEAVYTLQRARRAHVQLHWSSGAAPTQPAAQTVGSQRQGNNDHEMAHGLVLPTAVYPLFENALRRQHGWSISEHRRQIGTLCARMTDVAAQNPYAWFPQQRSADELMTVTPQNRMIGFPYPKYVNAIMDVDQAAVVLLTSVGMARRLGIDRSRWIYLHGCADTQDHWYVSERVNYHSSPAIRRAGQTALAMAHAEISDIRHFDLYSCFPCAMQIARDMLAIAVDDPRPLTVTGGLPYAGGPGNNYVMHSIAAMVLRLRNDPGARGMVTALGWYITKHSIGIYSSEPPARPFVRQDPAVDQHEIDGQARPELVHQPEGAAVIETYTVLHDREGAPLRGLMVGRLADERRFLAEIAGTPATLAQLECAEGIGLPGRVWSKDGLNHFEL